MDAPHPKRHRPSYPKQRNAPHQKEAPAKNGPPADGPFMPMFLKFRDELDEHHDRRERIIKTSRDVTALSKKVIFSLQRARKLGSPLPDALNNEVPKRLEEIRDLLTTISEDLQGLNAFRYERNISGGIQEFIETLSFHHYLTTGTLMRYPDALEHIPAGIELSASDYVLGMFDFVGEVMRFGITMVALGGAGKEGGEVYQILMDLRRLREEFEGLDIGGGGGGFLGKEVDKKMQVMQTCVNKVENAVYGVIVRGSEKSPGWVPELGDDWRDDE